MKRIHLTVVVICALFWTGCSAAVQPKQPDEVAVKPTPKEVAASDDDLIGKAFKTRRSDVLVEGGGVVTRILSDDLAGGRHQRFIVRLASEQTVLVSHNIDLAPRIEGLREGDRVRFKGEFVWNQQGGIIHWTHHDPTGRHVAGWVAHNGRTYQ